MNENLNLIEVLKDAEGTILYSSLCGYCKFTGIDNSSPLCIVLSDSYDRKWHIYCNGRVTREGECVVFPSKENRDWSTFSIKSPQHKSFKPYQKVLVKGYSEPSPNHKIWFPDIYLFYDEENSCHRVACNKYIYNDDNIIPYNGNEDKLGKVIK